MTSHEIEISEIIEGLVGQIPLTITGVYDPINLYTKVCATDWLRVGKKIYDATGNEFTITEIEADTYIKATNKDGLLLDGVITIYGPLFLSGTKTATSLEFTKITKDVIAKTPLIWLVEFIRLQKYGRESALDFSTELRIFFLDETNILNYKTKDHRLNVVNPMGRLLDAFIDVVGKDRRFKRLVDYEVLTFSRFGTETDAGAFQNILDANLSGLELRITLEMFKKNCKNCN